MVIPRRMSTGCNIRSEEKLTWKGTMAGTVRTGEGRLLKGALSHEVMSSLV